ncbi:hypothetical protein [Stutzerimonas stutzeri]|uniref:hypothetical protein n=1 Tax=Stutzerimonas stutzeri TaxID=316 RepID=UPI0015E35BAB|nr:hypothetical protein [Stutzerimonas stutzeri]MBA1280209.1 hypothetical protein [Stutzerimonas stutzeri]
MRIGLFALKALASAFLVASVAGCTTPVGEFSDRSSRHSQELDDWKKRMDAPRDDRVRITSLPSAGERIKLEKHRWLKDKRISLTLERDGSSVSASALAQMLKAKGINIMSSLPLSNYHYSGFGVVNVDGESALRMLFGPMGLDYDINDEGQYVVVTPMRSRTFYVKLGERKTKYRSGTMTGNIGGGGSNGSGGGTSSGNVGTGGDMGGTSSGGSTGISTGLDTGAGEVSVEGDFWANITTELAALLTQCVPTSTTPAVVSATSSLPPLPPEMGGSMPSIEQQFMQQMQQSAPVPAAPAAAVAAELCREQKLGNYSVNPTTGAITVQAPHWVMESIAKYLENVKSDNAVTLIYEGMLIAVTSVKEKSEGIDLQAFASFANGELGMIVNNNALGGITISPGGTGTPPVAVPGTPAVAGTLLGLQKLTGNPAQAFLAYLEANADFSIKQKPRLAVTNGVPGEFAQYDTLYYNQISQETSSGNNGGALVGTTNTLVPFKVGTLLRIIPYYDTEKGLARSPITFSQSVQTGSFESTQYITDSSGNTTGVPSFIPLIRDSNYAGEVLMRDGDMLIIGGQVSESSDSSGSGIPGYNAKGNIFSGLMGQKKHKDQVNTYYLALTLKVNES